MRKLPNIDNANTAWIADKLKISKGRVRQIVREMKLRPVVVWSGMPFYSLEQIERIKNRNTKPGPKPKGGKK